MRETHRIALTKTNWIKLNLKKVDLPSHATLITFYTQEHESCHYKKKCLTSLSETVTKMRINPEQQHQNSKVERIIIEAKDLNGYNK